MLENSLETKLNKEDKIPEKDNSKKDNKKSNIKEDEIQKLLDPNNEKLNDLIEELIQDKDFMNEFLLMEKKNLLMGKKRERENNYDMDENEKKNLLTKKDFEAIYKELDSSSKNNDQNKNKINKKEEEKKEQEFLNGDELRKKTEYDGKNSYLNEIILDDMGEGVYEKEQKEDIFPYYRLFNLIKQYGINKILNLLIDIFNNSNKIYKNNDDNLVKEEIIDITNNIRKDVLFIYLMKIIANNKHLSFFKGAKNKNEKGIIPKKKFEDVDYQFRSRHFHWKHGILYSYAPKNKIRSSKCYLYCGKGGCEAKVKIDMVEKKALFIGSHNDHEGINVKKYIYEYPELENNDWKHLQYDCYHGKKIFMWKY